MNCQIGDRVVCTLPSGPLIKDKVYTIIDISLAGCIALEDLTDSDNELFYWATKRFSIYIKQMVVTPNFKRKIRKLSI